MNLVPEITSDICLDCGIPLAVRRLRCVGCEREHVLVATANLRREIEHQEVAS